MMIQLFDGFTYNTKDILRVAQYFCSPFGARSIELKKCHEILGQFLERRSPDNVYSVFSENLAIFFWTMSISEMNYLIGSGIS